MRKCHPTRCFTRVIGAVDSTSPFKQLRRYTSCPAVISFAATRLIPSLIRTPWVAVTPAPGRNLVCVLYSMDTRRSCRYPCYYWGERAQDYDQEQFNNQLFHVV